MAPSDWSCTSQTKKFHQKELGRLKNWRRHETSRDFPSQNDTECSAPQRHNPREFAYNQFPSSFNKRSQHVHGSRGPRPATCAGNKKSNNVIFEEKIIEFFCHGKPLL
jgi:hypothetical protein